MLTWRCAYQYKRRRIVNCDVLGFASLLNTLPARITVNAALRGGGTGGGELAAPAATQQLFLYDNIFRSLRLNVLPLVTSPACGSPPPLPGTDGASMPGDARRLQHKNRLGRFWQNHQHLTSSPLPISLPLQRHVTRRRAAFAAVRSRLGPWRRFTAASANIHFFHSPLRHIPLSRRGRGSTNAASGHAYASSHGLPPLALMPLRRVNAASSADMLTLAVDVGAWRLRLRCAAFAWRVGDLSVATQTLPCGVFNTPAALRARRSLAHGVAYMTCTGTPTPRSLLPASSLTACEDHQRLPPPSLFACTLFTAFFANIAPTCDLLLRALAFAASLMT